MQLGKKSLFCECKVWFNILFLLAGLIIVYCATRENKCFSRVARDFFLPRGSKIEWFAP